MGKRKKILLVDDNDTLREMLGDALRSGGYLVETACDGLSGLQKLEEDSYGLLITDNQMPRMGGLKLIEEITRREMDIKILLISGDLTGEVIKKAGERGVFECLAKPFSLYLFREMVREVLEKDTVINSKHKLDQSPQLSETAAL